MLAVTIVAVALAWTAWSRSGRVGLPVAAWPDMRLDVNTASAAELNALPGIGPRLSWGIVAERDTNGPFVALDDLQRVRGVGPAVVERIEAHAVVELQE